MLSLMPIIFFIITIIIFQKIKIDTSWRISFLRTSLIWGIIIALTTEILSLFSLIGFWGILSVWFLNILMAWILLCKIIKKNQRKLHFPLFIGISRFNLILLIAVLFIIVSVGFVGLISPPNTWDSMTYHMSRVVHWIQDRSIVYYPTHILRQLHQNPWAEFAILHFQILNRSDRFANSIQWFSMIGSILGGSLIAKELGASSRGQIFACVIIATLPMGILQGSSTQNDYVVSFWLVCYAYFAIILKRNGGTLDALAVGVSLGLAILTKATAYIYAFPFMVWIGLSLVKTHRTKGIRLIGIIAITVIVINFGHYSRNYNFYSNPLGPGQEEGYNKKYANEIFTISSLTSNLIRNIGLHIETPFKQVNSILESRIYKLHRIIGIDPNDIRTTWADKKFHIPILSYHEDAAGNPFHLTLIIGLMPIVFWQQRKQKDGIYYLICIIFAIILFSLYLKWQPWNSRLHLPLFVLLLPIIGLSLSQIRFHNIANLIIIILILGAIPYLLKNQSRSIIGEESILTTSRTKMYFSNRPLLADPYINSVEYILGSQCADIGLLMGANDWEYPIWVLLQNYKREIRIEHINVTNISQKKTRESPFVDFIPCALIVINNNPPNEVLLNTNIYSQKLLLNPVSVYMQR